MRMDVIPVGKPESGVVRETADVLESAFGGQVRVREGQPVPGGAYDGDRDQCRAEPFAEEAIIFGEGGINVAVTDRDLYHRRRNYVFGVGYLGGDGAVVSTYRLETSADQDEDAFRTRLRKSVLKQAGHMVGLENCDDADCVMSFSSTVRDLDRKGADFCADCRGQRLE